MTTPQLKGWDGAVHVHNIDTSLFSENRKRENKGKVGRNRHVLRFGFVAAVICVGNADQKQITHHIANISAQENRLKKLI